MVNIADPIYVLGHLFPGGGPANVLSCDDSADCNRDGALNIADVISLLGSLFGTPTLPLVFPNADDGCGVDELMGCGLYDACP